MLEANRSLRYVDRMKDFFWGVLFGATALYLYAAYGDQLHEFRRYTLQWRDWAVHQSDGYSVGRDKEKK